MTTQIRLSQTAYEHERTGAVVVLVGDASLASALTLSLRTAPEVTVSYQRTLSEIQNDFDNCQTKLVVALSAHFQPAYDNSIQRWCREQQVTFLRVSVWQHEAVIGPFVPPDASGCVECAERCRLRAQAFMTENELRFLNWYKDETNMPEDTSNPWLTRAALNTISTLATADIEAFIAHVPPIGIHTVRFVCLRSLTNRCHHFLPDPLCTICGKPTPDCAKDACIHFEPRMRRDSATYRLRSLPDELETLEARYVDRRLGMQISSGSADTFARTLTHFFEYPHIKQTITCTGMAHSFRASRATAIVEGLERYSSIMPRAKSSTAYGSYRQLQDQAIDPTQFGLYTPELDERHKKYAYPYDLVKYHPDLAFHWVWAYSLRHMQPVLVPEQIAYYASSALRPRSERFVLDNSNGCAIGSSLEEASLYSLFEVVERDAFMLTWYARLRLRAVDWHSTRDLNLQLLLERASLLTGCEFLAFDATTDLGLPVILAFAINPNDEAPKVYYSAAAHCDPDRALAGAFYEIASVILERKELFQAQAEKAERLFKDSSLIFSIEDHVLASGIPLAFSRLDFLLQKQPLLSMTECFAAQYAEARSSDLTQEFLSQAQRIINRGYDIIIVKQTAPELTESNLHCVRALVPGLLPLTFGHDFRRTHGLARLYHLPKELGYTGRILTEADLNQDPHGFA